LPRFTWWMRSKKVLKSGHISHFSIAILNTEFFSDFFRRCWNELGVFPYQDLYVDKSQYCTTHSCNRKMQLHCRTTCFHYWRPPVWTDQQNSLPSFSLFHWSQQRPWSQLRFNQLVELNWQKDLITEPCQQRRCSRSSRSSKEFCKRWVSTHAMQPNPVGIHRIRTKLARTTIHIIS